ncbi:hypothetical protein DEO72_LG3g1646 [Vigna unguiculata]|uniref:Uncharacterized protein n=1 Tax=Vigna unguiculata TaxID=3917 RepID=A0A4D6LG01_VIGUN|nr:hypothetical protein DEO72_LG3g1646 [Vigna unguiculata]
MAPSAMGRRRRGGRGGGRSVERRRATGESLSRPYKLPDSPMPPATACGDGGRSNAVAAHRGCRASRGGGGWLEQQVVERKRER